MVVESFLKYIALFTNHTPCCRQMTHVVKQNHCYHTINILQTNGCICHQFTLDIWLYLCSRLYNHSWKTSSLSYSIPSQCSPIVSYARLSTNDPCRECDSCFLPDINTYIKVYFLIIGYCYRYQNSPWYRILWN